MSSIPQSKAAAIDSAGVWFPPPLIYAGVFALALAAGRVWPLQAPAVVRIGVVPAIIFLLIGMLILSWAFMNFRKFRTTPFPHRPSTALVTSGPFSWSRNPMYLSLALVQLGAAVMVGNLWAILTLPIAVFLVDRCVVGREERYLERKFGDAYRDYCRRVRRWL